MKKYYLLIIVIILVFYLFFSFYFSLSAAEFNHYLKGEVLRRGDRGVEVALVQRQLKDLMLYNDDIDGIYGPKTEYAVKKFQQKNNLFTDGIVGSETKNYLFRYKTLNYKFYSRDEILLLARVINGEARAEPLKGMVAVGAVILNRVQEDKFPDTIKGVITQEYQFHAVTNGQADLFPSDKSIDAARIALLGYDPTGNALFFYNPETTIDTHWVPYKTPTIRIANHVFLK